MLASKIKCLRTRSRLPASDTKIDTECSDRKSRQDRPMAARQFKSPPPPQPPLALPLPLSHLSTSVTRSDVSPLPPVPSKSPELLGKVRGRRCDECVNRSDSDLHSLAVKNLAKSHGFTRVEHKHAGDTKKGDSRWEGRTFHKP